MRPIIALLTTLLVGLCLTSCSKESPPTEKKEEPVVQIPQPATLPSQQMADKAEREMKEPLPVPGGEVKPQAEGVKKEGAGSAVPDQKAQGEVVREAQQIAPGMTGEKTVAPADAPKASPAAGPAVIVYEASMGKVTFNHSLHAGQVACSKCHPTDPPQKISIDKEVAHNRLCIVCHKESGGNAPTSCKGCHTT